VSRRLVVVWAGLAACSGIGPQQIGARPSWRDPSPVEAVARPITLAPATAAAARYNEPPQAPPPGALNDAVIAAVRDAASRIGVRAPFADARLFRACAELAEIVPVRGVIGYRLVEFAIQRNGIVEPSPHLLVVWGAIDSPELVVDQLKPQLENILRDGSNARVGVGAARRNPDGTGVVVFALQGSGVTTAPIQRELAADATIVIDAIVDPRYRDPKVLVTHDDGSTQLPTITRGRPGGFIARVECRGRAGRQQIEIAASDAAGATVLANFPVWCGARAPTAVTIDPESDDVAAATTEEAEHRLLANVNRDRVAAGLPPLLWDDALAGVARRYSSEMNRTHVVAHISPVSGSAVDRVRAANVKTAVVLENIARAYGVNEAHDALMNSPGHRANLMSGVATHIGIGVVFGEEAAGRRELFITQVFSRVPPKIDRASAVDAVRKKITAARSGTSMAAELAAIAQLAAVALATGRSSEQAFLDVKQQLRGAVTHYQRVRSVMKAVSDLEALDASELVGDAQGHELGIGVAQGPHPEIGEGAIWVVVLFANR
jgi:uncharacterized protein YkwD